MLQQDYLFEWRTILDNAVLGAEIQGADMAAARERAAAASDPLRPRPVPATICRASSRAGCASASRSPARSAPSRTSCCSTSRSRRWIPRPGIALADEVSEILRREGKTAILVTHDIGEAVSMAERVIVLSRRPGRVKSEHADPLRHRRRQPPGAVRRAQRARVQRLFQCPLAGARSPCRRLNPAALPSPEPAISRMAAPRAARPPDRAADAARNPGRRSWCFGRCRRGPDLVNPLFTSYPSTIWPTFLEMLKATPQQAGHPHSHLGDRAGDRDRLHRRR